MRKLLPLLLLIGAASAQTVLMPMPRQCFNDSLSTGKPLAGGKIFTYQAGTSVQQATFTDATGVTQNTNPVILDLAGCASIWLTSGQSYRFVAQNSSGAQEWVTDSVSGLATTASAFAQALTTVSFSATPTFTTTGQYQVFKMTLTGNVTSSTLNMSGVATPSIVTFELTQDGTGGRTFTFPLNVSGAAALNSAANSVTNQTFFWDGSTAFSLDSLVNKTLVTPTITNPAVTSGTFSNSTLTTPTLNGTLLNYYPVQVIYKNVTPTTHTGDTTLDTIYSTTIPALSITSTLRITTELSSVTQGAGTTLVGLYLGGTLIGSLNITASRTACVISDTTSNLNSVSSQASILVTGCDSVPVINNAGSAVNTGVSQTLALKVTNANNSDSQILSQFIVEIF